MTESRLLSSANYVRTELPTRVAHRIRDMQTLPYVVVTNPHMSHVYELYYQAFESLRRVNEIKTVEENDQFCKIISSTLQEHLTVIPKLAMGLLECQGLMKSEEMDRFMNTILRSVCPRSDLITYRPTANVLLLAAHLTTGHCRAASGPDRDLQLALALSRGQIATRCPKRLRRRGVPPMQCS